MTTSQKTTPRTAATDLADGARRVAEAQARGLRMLGIEAGSGPIPATRVAEAIADLLAVERLCGPSTDNLSRQAGRIADADRAAAVAAEIGEPPDDVMQAVVAVVAAFGGRDVTMRGRFFPACSLFAHLGLEALGAVTPTGLSWRVEKGSTDLYEVVEAAQQSFGSLVLVHPEEFVSLARGIEPNPDAFGAIGRERAMRMGKVMRDAPTRILRLAALAVTEDVDRLVPRDVPEHDREASQALLAELRAIATGRA